jgi:hypothetical protein
MEELTMLHPEKVDLSDLALALEDHSEEHTWWLDPATGDLTVRFSTGPDEDPEDGAQGSLLRVEPLPSAVSYSDMEEFVACVRDPRARDLLERAIAGRGAFRRFKDALLEKAAEKRSLCE